MRNGARVFCAIQKIQTKKGTLRNQKGNNNKNTILGFHLQGETVRDLGAMKGCKKGNGKSLLTVSRAKKMEEFVKGEEGSRGLRSLTLQLNADDDDDDDASVTSLGWNNGKSGGDLVINKKWILFLFYLYLVYLYPLLFNSFMLKCPLSKSFIHGDWGCFAKIPKYCATIFNLFDIFFSFNSNSIGKVLGMRILCLAKFFFFFFL